MRFSFKNKHEMRMKIFYQNWTNFYASFSPKDSYF